MITIKVDEGYAFDYLSILQVKARRRPADEAIQASAANCLSHLRQQLGTIADTVVASDEYASLLAINDETFDAVDKAKRDAIPASAVDALNYRRYECKLALQSRFFGGQMSEVKLGYK